MYRVYCQGKAPFPGIDGNLGFTKDVWEVQYNAALYVEYLSLGGECRASQGEQVLQFSQILKQFVDRKLRNDPQLIKAI
uniref:Uncharacterized protein n=1 Tax=Romanomermis culicivorax TaxID=13658 RepID=A0A915IDL1_ROMCU